MRKLLGIAMMAIMGAGAVIGRAETKLPFQVGEKLHYKVQWGILTVGSATLVVKDLVEVDGHPCYHLVGTMDSNSFFNKIYPVHSVIESYVDVEGLFSRKFVEDRHEGNYVRQREVTFDYDKATATLENKVTSKKQTFAITGHAQDGFSCIYYLRSQLLLENAKQTFTGLATKETVEVSLNTFEKNNLRLGALGTRAAIRVEPASSYQGIFSRKGGMSVWVSADDQKLPLMIVAKIPVGSVKVFLSEIETADDKSARPPIKSFAAHAKPDSIPR